MQSTGTHSSKSLPINSEFGQLLFSFFNTALQLINLKGKINAVSLASLEKKMGEKGVKLN